MPEFRERLAEASRQAGLALGDETPLPYTLQINRKNVAITPRDGGALKANLAALKSLMQGLPEEITLYQPQAWGFMGPFSKKRKNARSNASEISENALLFWPCPDGKISNSRTSCVLKIALGAKNHAREIKMLEDVHEAIGCVPKLLAKADDHNWLAIEYIASERTLSAEEQAKLYLDQICEPFFAHFKTRSEPAAQLVHGNSVSSHAFSRDNLVLTAKTLGIAGFEKLLEGNLTWSQTHGGGICEEIVLSRNGKAYLLDWEKADHAPIGDDLLQVFQYHPEQTAQIFEKFRTAETLSVRDQLIISLVFRHSFRLKKKKPTEKSISADHHCAKLLKNMEQD